MQDERTSPAPVHDRGHYEEHWDGTVAHQTLEIEAEPYYLPLGDEVAAFKAAYANRCRSC